MEFTILNLFTKKTLGPGDSLVSFLNIQPNYTADLPGNRKKGWGSSAFTSFYEARMTLKPKPNKAFLKGKLTG